MPILECLTQDIIRSNTLSLCSPRAHNALYMPPFKIFIYYLDALARPRCFEALFKVWTTWHRVHVNYEVGGETACWSTLLERPQYRAISVVGIFKKQAPILFTATECSLGPVDGKLNNLAITLVCHRVWKTQWADMAQLLHLFLSWHKSLFYIHKFSGHYSGSHSILRWNVPIEDLKEVAQNTVSKFVHINQVHLCPQRIWSLHMPHTV